MSEKNLKRNIISKNTAILTIALGILLLSSMLFAMPISSAHTPAWTIPTYAYINVAPNPAGVGQAVQVYMWLDTIYGAAGGTSAVVPTNGSTASAALLSNNYRFHNYQLTITSPNGTTSSMSFSVISDPTSAQGTTFTPTETGTYTFNFTFPGQVYGDNANGYEKSSLIGDTYAPSTTSTTLTVQQEAVAPPVSAGALPTAYWQEPIYGENSNWWSISSNWLGSGSPVPAGYTSTPLYHGDAIGPQTGHIMWTNPTQNGGIVGGNMFPDAQGVGYFEGSSYNPRFYNPIIINGYLYYTQTVSFTGSNIMGSSTSGPTICVNLRTGEQLWSNPNIPALSFGYIYNLWDPDQHGTFPPILVAAVGSGWNLYDGFTGASLFNVTNIPSGATAAGPNGEQLRYVMANAGTLTNPQWYLAQWNSSKLWQYDVNPYTGAGSLSPTIINSTGTLIGFVFGGQIPIPITGETGTSPNGAPVPVPYGSTLIVNANIPINDNDYAPGTTTPIKDINSGSLATYDWNISIPWRNTMSSSVTVAAVDYGDIMLCRNGSLPSGFAASGTGASSAPYTLFAVNLNASRGQVGSILWMRTYDPPSGNKTLQFTDVDYQTRVFAMQYYETMQWVGFNLDTGAPIWGPTPEQVAFNYYDWSGYDSGTMAYGNLYNGGFGGVTYCYDDLTGALKWTYGNGLPGSGNSTFAGSATPYGVYPTFIQSIANGIVYLATDEHTITNPIYKGALLTAINATTGQEIWKLSGYPSEWAFSGSAFVVADGYLTFFNGYDGQIYSVGRGPSQTTVTTPHAGLAFGQPVVISGSVFDVSAGTKQAQQAANFPNGVPVSSDASMKDWMGYVYQQQPQPTSFTGVPVTIAVTDSNNNCYVIGTATTDASGTYSLTWTPTISGNYTVSATFSGTNGYYPSSAEDHFTVAQEPAATTAATPAPASMVDTYFAPAVIGIILAIVIGFAVTIIVLRKRQ